MIDHILYHKTINKFCDYFKTLYSDSEEDRLKKINIMTIHSSKGLEFDYVFLPRWNEY